MHDQGGDDAREWDRFYDEGEVQTWSGRPNDTLVTEVGDLVPGTALDVGCGEGADAIWLARRGWRVTAVDPSRVALDRAATAAGAAGVEVTWVHAGLLRMPAGTGVHDLVSAHYPVLRRTPDDAAIAALLAAVAPGGTLLVVHHDLERSHASEHGFDPADHVMPVDVAARLDDDTWVIEAHEARARSGRMDGDRGHTRDLVLRARRRTT